ncbi:MAG: hypothetical protein V4685_15425 [Bacteroidota bacterium]
MKRIFPLLICGLSLTFQSCFDIIEEVSLKADGSGNFKMVLNMSRSKTKINSIMKMKTVNGHDVPTKTEIKQKVADIESVVKKTAGISNVKTVLDFENYIATITCNFSTVNSLNNAVKNIGDKEKNTKPGIEKNYEYDAAAKTFSRLNKFALKDEYQKLSVADREIFSTANYTGIFRFQNEVNSTSNTESKIAGNKKAVMLKQNALDIITNKKSIENKISLGK